MSNLAAIKTEIKTSLKLASPLMASNLVQVSSGFIGTLMIAHLGRDPLAGVALASPIYITFLVFFFGIINSTGILVAQSFGAKNKEGIRLAMSQGIFITFLAAVPMMILLNAVSTLFPLFEHNAQIVHYATDYLQALTWCVLPLAFVILFERFLIGVSKPRLVLWVSLLQVPVEIILSYLLVFGKFGFPNCGVRGIGYSFAIIFAVSDLLLGIYLHLAKNYRHYHIFKYLGHYKGKYFWEMLRIGWPIGGMRVLEVGMTAIMAVFMGMISSNQLAAYQVARQFFAIGMMLIFAMSQATTVRVGQAVGKNNKKEATYAAYVNMGIGFSVMLLLSLGYVFFAKDLIAIDLNIHDPKYIAIIHYSIIFLALAGVCQLLEGARFMLIGALRGLKDTKTPMLISALGFWVIALPISYLLAFTCHMGGTGLWLGFIAGIIIAGLMLLKRLKTTLKKADFVKMLT